MNFWEKLKKPFTVLAPMEGVTDTVFREIMLNTARPDVFFTEFTNVEGLCSDGVDKVEENLQFTPKQHPIVAQIWGLDPVHFYIAAQKIVKMGFDGIDINFGCPVKKIIKHGACAKMIGNYETAEKIIAAVKRGAPNLPVSVKTRLGYEKVMIDNWATFLLEQKIAALTIHGRIAISMSDGEANWEEIGKAVKIRDRVSPTTNVIGNGDINSFAQVLQMHQSYGVDGVMIGRGVFDDLWVFEKTVTPLPHSYDERLEMLRRHLKLYKDTWGDRDYGRMKKYFSMYVKGFEKAKELRLKLVKTGNCQEALDLLC